MDGLENWEVSSSLVCDPPELSADVFVSVLEQQDGRLVDLDGPVLSSRRAGVINIGLVEARTHTHAQTQTRKQTHMKGRCLN